MNALLERLAGFAARKHWVIIIAWLAILGGLLPARHAYGGEYVNNYKVSGSDSDDGRRGEQHVPAAGRLLRADRLPRRAADRLGAGIGRQPGTANVSKLPNVIKAVSPFSSSGSAAVSKDGTIAYASVAWNVNPDSLDTAYLDKLNNAVAPASKAGLQVEYGAGAGQIGQKTADLKSEIIGLSFALVLLLFMFGSVIAAAIPLVSAIFSVVAGLALLGLLAAAVTFPTTAPTIATLLGLGVAVDYGLFLVARHREQVDAGWTSWPRYGKPREPQGQRSSWPAAPWPSRSWAFTSRELLRRVARPGRGARGRGHDAGRADAGARVHGAIRENIRALSARFRARKAGLTAQQQAAHRRGHAGAA